MLWQSRPCYWCTWWKRDKLDGRFQNSINRCPFLVFTFLLLTTFLFIAPQISLNNIFLFLFGFLICLGFVRVLVFNTFLTSYSHRPRHRPHRYTTNLRAFHRKHMLLSHIMLYSWFISIHLRHCTVIGTMEFLNPTRDQTSRLRANLGISTFPPYPHTHNTNFYQFDTGPSCIDDLRAYAAQPSKSTWTLHLDSDSFDICIDTGASATCTMTADDFVPGTFQKLKGFSINGISSGLQVLGYGTIRWVLHDDTNVPIDVEIDRALLIQNLPMRLLSPQQVAR